ncbi:MAG TPA: protein kinase, partial [Planctomycetaceae bacterium]|nr:protein kinase [Planctomycetaceae bacterium]
MASGSIPPGGQRTSDAPPRPSLDGRSSLGKYEIVRELGAGGMGTVYLAVDSQLKRTVALKVLPKERTENETLVRRFEAEAQAAAQLKHENIVTIYDAGRIDGYLFIALEFVEGTDIYDLVARRGPLPLKRSINFVKQVANALEHLHKRGFVHRDIKPSNILVTREGMVKLTDMGLARAVDESLKSNITREGTTVGTVDYMAPEQARDSQAADIRSDIYSLGCTWYQMLTGEPPFPTGSVTNKLYSHISKPRPDPRALNRSVPEEVVAILHRMMARKPVDRHQTPAEVLEEISNLGAGNKRIEELLSGDTEDDSPVAPTPAYGSPLTLPPRHLPNRSDDSGRHAPKSVNEQTPRPNRLPARRGRGQADPSASPQTPPPQRLPGRQAKSGADPTPAPRSPARQAPEAQDDSVSRSRIRDGRVHPVPEEPEVTGRTPAKGRAENSVPSDRESIGSNKDRTASNSDNASSNKDHASSNRDHVASDRDQQVASNKENVASSRGRLTSQKDNVTSKRNRVTWNKENETSSAANAMSNVDWKPFAVKAASIVGGVLALGACVWLGISWRNSATGHGDEGATKSPFAAVAANLPEDAEKEASDKKTQEKPAKSDGKAKALNKNPGLPVSFQKGANDPKPSDTSAVLGRPEERKNFPAWIPELWNPNAPPNAAGANGLKTITVGRVGNERADAPSLTAAIEQLPEQGGIIQLRGPGPFILPAIKIANRRRLIIAGAKAKSSPSTGTSTAEAKPGTENEDAPLIVLVPGPGPAADSGLLAIETSLTFYGVHLAAFADQFPGDGPLHLIDARSGDLTVQKCSLTLVGTRNGSTIAFSVSAPLARSGTERPARILLDRTFLRGKDLTALDADLRSVDLLAINSLFAPP